MLPCFLMWDIVQAKREELLILGLSLENLEMGYRVTFSHVCLDKTVLVRCSWTARHADMKDVSPCLHLATQPPLNLQNTVVICSVAAGPGVLGLQNHSRSYMGEHGCSDHKNAMTSERHPIHHWPELHSCSWPSMQDRLSDLLKSLSSLCFSKVTQKPCGTILKTRFFTEILIKIN